MCTRRLGYLDFLLWGFLALYQWLLRLSCHCPDMPASSCQQGEFQLFLTLSFLHLVDPPPISSEVNLSF